MRRCWRAPCAPACPSLRFYRWQGPWLSLGYGQILDRERIEACGRAGVGVVRRVTGGRAVLHGSDLTYCVSGTGRPASRRVDGVLRAGGGGPDQGPRGAGSRGGCESASPLAGRPFNTASRSIPRGLKAVPSAGRFRLLCSAGRPRDLRGRAKARGKCPASRQRWHFTARFDPTGPGSARSAARFFAQWRRSHEPDGAGCEFGP